MIVDGPTTLSTIIYESLIPMLVVKFLSMPDIIIVGFTKPLDTEMPIIVDILIVPLVLILVAPIKEVITPTSPHGGIYFYGY